MVDEFSTGPGAASLLSKGGPEPQDGAALDWSPLDEAVACAEGPNAGAMAILHGFVAFGEGALGLEFASGLARLQALKAAWPEDRPAGLVLAPLGPEVRRGARAGLVAAQVRAAALQVAPRLRFVGLSARTASPEPRTLASVLAYLAAAPVTGCVIDCGPATAPDPAGLRGWSMN